MSGIRSITLGTENIDKTYDLFHNIIGMPCKNRKMRFNLAMPF
ncbi:hypothetical protein [Staphylococcus sp. 11261D007BR]